MVLPRLEFAKSKLCLMKDNLKHWNFLKFARLIMRAKVYRGENKMGAMHTVLGLDFYCVVVETHGEYIGEHCMICMVFCSF